MPLELEQLWREGYGQVKLAAHYGASRHQVRKWLSHLELISGRSVAAPNRRALIDALPAAAPERRRRGVHSPGKDWPPSPARLEELIEQFPIREIATQHGVSPNSVRYWLDEYEIPRTRPCREVGSGPLERIPPPPRERLVQLYETERRSAKDIAELLGVSGQTIGKWLAGAQIPVRDDNHVNSRTARQAMNRRQTPIPHSRRRTLGEDEEEAATAGPPEGSSG